MALINQFIRKIRQAIYGADVRESIAKGFEAINNEVENTTQKQNDLENTFEQLVINAGNSNAEIVSSRGGYTTLDKRLNANDELTECIKPNKPTNIGICSHAYYTGDIELHLNKYKEIGCKFELVVYISISGNNSDDFNATCIEAAKSWLTRAAELGVECALVKIHLVVNNSDAASKGEITATKSTTYFDNYFIQVKKYCDICKTYGIKNIVIANENAKVFNPENYQYFSSAFNSLKETYNTLNFSYSATPLEAVANLAATNSIFNLCDFISLNFYPSVSYINVYDGTESERKMKEKFYYDNSVNYTQIVNDIKEKYGVKIWITETGCMGRKNSLYSPIDPTLSQPKDSLITGIYFKIMVDCIGKIDDIDGFFFWSARGPFEIFNTSGETFIKKYVGGAN